MVLFVGAAASPKEGKTQWDPDLLATSVDHCGTGVLSSAGKEMEMKEFSRRYGHRQSPEKLIVDGVPFLLRQATLEMFRELLERHEGNYMWWYDKACVWARVPKNDLMQIAEEPAQLSGLAYRFLEDPFMKSEWYHFYDCVERIAQELEGREHIEFVRAFEQLCVEHWAGYRLEYQEGFSDEGLFPTTLPVLVHRSPAAKELEFEASAEAETFFTGKLADLGVQYKKARQLLNSRPPDLENAVKDAVEAAKGVAQVLAGMPEASMDDVVEALFPSPTEYQQVLFDGFRHVQKYRNKLPGSGHSRHTAPAIGPEETEYVLNVCAAMIIYLVNKFPNRC